MFSHNTSDFLSIFLGRRVAAYLLEIAIVAGDLRTLFLRGVGTSRGYARTNPPDRFLDCVADGLPALYRVESVGGFYLSLFAKGEG